MGAVRSLGEVPTFTTVPDTEPGISRDINYATALTDRLALQLLRFRSQDVFI